MAKKTTILIPVAALVLFAALCMTAATSSAMSTVPGKYHFFGRVMNQEEKPVAGCTVLLVKRMTLKEKKQSGEQGQADEKQYTVTNEEVVAVTDKDGNYAFAFEPLTADNFWVFFKADGYKARSMELNKRMRSRFFQKPNKSPISLSVVLEKE